MAEPGQECKASGLQARAVTTTAPGLQPKQPAEGQLGTVFMPGTRQRFQIPGGDFLPGLGAILPSARMRKQCEEGTGKKTGQGKFQRAGRWAFPCSTLAGGLWSLPLSSVLSCGVSWGRLLPLQNGILTTPACDSQYELAPQDQPLPFLAN